MTTSTTDSIESFLHLSEGIEKISEKELIHLAMDGDIFLYILARAEIETLTGRKQRFVYLEPDEIERLYVDGEIEIDITLDRWVNSIVYFDGIAEPFRFEEPPAPLVCSRKVTEEQVLIKKSEIEAYLAKLNDPRPEKLQIANRAWNELFSHGIDIPSDAKKYLSRMGIAKNWLRENTKELEKNHKKFPIDKIASLICEDTTRTEIRESVQVSHNNNTPDHPFFASELAIANECWTELFSNNKNRDPKRGPKDIIERWLGKKYPDLPRRAKERISLAVNPRPQGGTPKI